MWLEQLRALCTKADVPLVFDEVYTGFRMAVGGAQQYYGVYADMVAYGKTLGGGMPVRHPPAKTSPPRNHQRNDHAPTQTAPPPTSHRHPSTTDRSGSRWRQSGALTPSPRKFGLSSSVPMPEGACVPSRYSFCLVTALPPQPNQPRHQDTIQTPFAHPLQVGVVCGKRKLMARFDPDHPLRVSYVIGTFAAAPAILGPMAAFLEFVTSPVAQVRHCAHRAHTARLLPLWPPTPEAVQLNSHQKTCLARWPFRVRRIGRGAGTCPDPCSHALSLRSPIPTRHALSLRSSVLTPLLTPSSTPPPPLTLRRTPSRTPPPTHRPALLPSPLPSPLDPSPPFTLHPSPPLDSPRRSTSAARC